MKVADKTELYYAEAHALQPNGRSRTRSTKTRTLNVKHATFNAQRRGPKVDAHALLRGKHGWHPARRGSRKDRQSTALVAGKGRKGNPSERVKRYSGRADGAALLQTSVDYVGTFVSATFPWQGGRGFGPWRGDFNVETILRSSSDVTAREI